MCVDILNKRIRNGVYMFKAARSRKNYLNSNEMIQKSMFKRRRLALAAISHICDNVQMLKVVK